MNSNEPLQSAIRALNPPNLQKLGISSFLNDAVSMARAAHSFDSISSDFTKQIASMTSGISLSRHLLRSLELPKTSTLRFIEEASKSAAAHRNLGLFADNILKSATSIRASSGFSSELSRSLQPTKIPSQLVIDGIQKTAFQLHHDTLQHVRKQFDSISKLTNIFSSSKFDGTSRVMQQAMGASQLWQSAPLTEFAGRIVRETEFRDAVIARFEAEEFDEAQSEISGVSTQQIIDAVERGIEESAGVDPSENVETTVAKIFDGWSKLSPDLRNLALMLLAGIILLVIEYGCFSKDEAGPPLHVNERVKIVQKITNNYFLNIGVSAEERRQFRIVTKSDLAVYQSNRRDSAKIGTLAAAQVVAVISKRRNWAQVEWKDTDTHEMRTGWVFTRYLKGFKP